MKTAYCFDLDGTVSTLEILPCIAADLGIADELPAKIERTDHCRLTREQATLYKAVVDDLLGRGVWCRHPLRQLVF